jgi:hypothetical protein
LIVINGSGNPQLLYLSNRKGWVCNDDQLKDTSYIKNAIDLKCKFIVINKHSDAEIKYLNLFYETVFENDDFLVFDTSNSANPKIHKTKD